MKIISGERASGRSTELVHWASQRSESGKVRYLVASNHQECWMLADMARGLGLTINFPLTLREAMDYRGYPAELAIDNADSLLQSLFGGRVDIITVGASVPCGSMAG